jgi:beta-lactam-binding protein with PASTA domain
LGFLWWCIRWGFATIFFIGIMALAAYYVFNRAASGGSYVEVPNLNGMSIQQAVLVLQDRGLDLGKPEEVPSDQEPGRVIAQHPPANSVVRAGRKVLLTVSTIQRKGIPNLIGKVLDAETENLVHTHNLVLARNPARIPSSEPLNTILSQDPMPSQDGVPQGTEIHVLVSDGPSQAFLMMPELVGMSTQSALAQLKEMGLEAKVEAIDAPDRPYYVVLDQWPADGTWLTPGTEVVCRVRREQAAEPVQRTYQHELIYTVPFSWTDRQVRFEFVPQTGRRETVQRLVKGGETYPLRVPFTAQVEEITVNVYIVDAENPNGRKVRSYLFRGEGPPVETPFP